MKAEYADCSNLSFEKESRVLSITFRQNKPIICTRNRELTSVNAVETMEVSRIIMGLPCANALAFDLTEYLKSIKDGLNETKEEN